MQVNVIHVMRGSKDGFVSKMKTVCNNLVDVEGCSSHQGNLLTKDMIKEFPYVKAVVNFVENLSKFVENKSKVRSILKESSAFLGISRLPDYAETRFLNLYLVIEAIVTQYHFSLYIIFQSSLVYSDVTIRHLKDLSQRFNLSPTDVADDYAKLRVKITTEFKLINLFLENELTEFP